MKKLRLSCVLLLSGSLVLSARAQTTTSARFVKEYYAGASLFRDNQYEVYYPDGVSHLSGINPWQVLVGVRLAPRWAVQVGYSYSYDLNDEDPYATGTSLTGQYIEEASHALLKEHATVALGRYTFLRNRLGQKGRVRAEALLGGTLLHSYGEGSYTTRTDGVVTRYSFRSHRGWQTYATGGLGLSYQYGPHLGLVADWTWSKNLQTVSEAAHRQVSGTVWGLTEGFSLGLRYYFHLAQPAATSAAP